MELDPEKFTVDAMIESETEKEIRKEVKNILEPNFKLLGKFDPMIFKSHQNGFIYLLKKSIEVHSETLLNMIRYKILPTTFDTEEE